MIKPGPAARRAIARFMIEPGNNESVRGRGRRRIVLHIGAEKTGTTSIQSWLADHRALWERVGVLYPRAAGTRNHMRLARWAHDEAAGAPGGPHAAFPSELAEECARTRAHTIVLSNEHCHSRLTGIAQIRRLLNLLSQLGEEIRVVLYLRRQDRLAVSLFSTALKMGHAPNTILPSLEQGLPYYYDFRAIVRNWATVFGTDRLLVRRFAGAAFEGGSLLNDFAAAAGLPTNVGIPEPPRENESLTELAQRFLFALNSITPKPRPRNDDVYRRDIVESLTKRYSGRGMQPSRMEAERFYAPFREGNEQVRRACFPDQSAPLFDESFGDYPEEGAVPGPAAAAEYAEVFSYLWKCRPRQIEVLLGQTPA